MNSHREKLGEWIESERIQKWIIGIIIFNAIMLGLQTSDYLESNFGELFDILDIVIPTIFIIEIELPKREGWLKMTVATSMEGMDIQGIMTRIGPLKLSEANAVLKCQLLLSIWGYQGLKAQFS